MVNIVRTLILEHQFCPIMNQHESSPLRTHLEACLTSIQTINVECRTAVVSKALGATTFYALLNYTLYGEGALNNVC